MAGGDLLESLAAQHVEITKTGGSGSGVAWVVGQQGHLAEKVAVVQARQHAAVLVHNFHLAMHDEVHLVARRALAADDVAGYAHHRPQRDHQVADYFGACALEHRHLGEKVPVQMQRQIRA